MSQAKSNSNDNSLFLRNYPQVKLQNLSKQDIIDACFIKDTIKKSSEPDAIIVIGDLTSLDTLIPAINKACELYPNSRVIIASGRDFFSELRHNPSNVFSAMKSFEKATGLKGKHILEKSEAIVIKEILTSNKKDFQFARGLLKSMTFAADRIITANGYEYHSKLESARLAMLYLDDIHSTSSLCLIAPKHAKRTYLSAITMFPEVAENDDIELLTYAHKEAGQLLDENFVMNTDCKKASVEQKKALLLIEKEIDNIAKYGPDGEGYFEYTKEVEKVMRKGLYTQQILLHELNSKYRE